jgi:DNA-binding response OmpR family regulator
MQTILIAEGDDRVAELFADLFTLEGWTVAPYNAGQRAVDALAGSASYDAVLVNNRLHGMSGVELIERIRSLAHRRHLPIVMVTGSGEVDVVAAALAAGADDVLYKPVDVAILVDTVNKCVERRRGHEPSAPA